MRKLYLTLTDEALNVLTWQHILDRLSDVFDDKKQFMEHLHFEVTPSGGCVYLVYRPFQWDGDFTEKQQSYLEWLAEAAYIMSWQMVETGVM